MTNIKLKLRNVKITDGEKVHIFYISYVTQ